MAKNTLYKSSITARKVILGILVFFVIATLLNFVGNIPTVTVIPPVGDNSLWMATNPVFGPISGINTLVEVEGIKIDPSVAPIFQLTGVEQLIYPDSAFVYEIETPTRGLTDIFNAEEVARKLGFTRDEFINKETTTQRACPSEVCIWEKSDKTRRLQFEVLKKRWLLKIDYNSDNVFRRNPEFETNSVPNEILYLSAVNLLDTLGFTNVSYPRRNSNNISIFFSNVTFAGDFVYDQRISNTILTYLRKVLNFANPKADLPRDITLNPITSQVYFPNPRQGQLKIVGFSSLTPTDQNIYELEFYDRKLTNRVGSYQIISPREAWTKISLGQGILVDLQTNDPFFVSPKEVRVSEFRGDRSLTEMAFLEPIELNDINKNLITPIYVFRGIAFLTDGSQRTFTFFVDALRRF